MSITKDIIETIWYDMNMYIAKKLIKVFHCFDALNCRCYLMFFTIDFKCFWTMWWNWSFDITISWIFHLILKSIYSPIFTEKKRTNGQIFMKSVHDNHPSVFFVYIFAKKNACYILTWILAMTRTIVCKSVLIVCGTSKALNIARLGIDKAVNQNRNPKGAYSSEN